MHTATISPPIYKGIRIVNRPDLENCYRLDRAALPMITDMERWGMCVDPTYLVGLNTRLTGEMAELDAKIAKETGYAVNLGSGDQLADLIYNKLGLKQSGSKEKYTKKKTRLAIDGDILETMRFSHPSIPDIIDWKEREKLRSTYTYSLIHQADSDSRIHSDLSTTRTDTGRLASSDPNLQNIPVRSDLGKEVRNAFIPTPKGMCIGSYLILEAHVLGTMDLSQIEMRVHASDSQCENMLELFWRREDLYWGTAELMFDRIFNQHDRKHGVTENGRSFKDEYRFPAKTTTLGVSYDITPEGLLNQIVTSIAMAMKKDPAGAAKSISEWSEERCAQMIVKFFKAYWEILNRRKEHHRRARQYELVWDMWGRIRRIPQVRSSLEWVVREGLRQAGNMPIQGAAAGIMKLLMAKIDARVRDYWSRFGIFVLMQIHDELLCEGPKAAVEDFLEECKEIARKLMPMEYFFAPVDASSAIGMRWGELEK